MSKSTSTSWNPLRHDMQRHWQAIKGMEGMAEELTLSIAPVTGEYTRLTRFFSGGLFQGLWGQNPPLSRGGFHRQRSSLRSCL